MRKLAISAAASVGAILVFAFAGSPGTADAASFDCARARTSSERVICGNRALEDRDVKMATLYGVVRQFQGGMGALGAIRDRQAAWLSERERCGANVACIRRQYDTRISELERGVAAAAAGRH